METYFGALIDEEIVEITSANQIVRLASRGQEQFYRELQSEVGRWADHLQRRGCREYEPRLTLHYSCALEAADQRLSDFIDTFPPFKMVF